MENIVRRRRGDREDAGDDWPHRTEHGQQRKAGQRPHDAHDPGEAADDDRQNGAERPGANDKNRDTGNRRLRFGR
jgi:hypothetical protein